MIWKLALLFTVIPIVEVALLLWIGSVLNPLWATLIVIVTGVLGAWLAKREGAGVLRKLRGDLARGVPPTGRIVEGVLVLAGGLLLVTPGVLTDFTGFFLIIPFTRRLVAPWVARRVVAWFTGDKELAKGLKLDFGDGPPEPDDAPDIARGPDPASRRVGQAPGGDPHFDHPVR